MLLVALAPLTGGHRDTIAIARRLGAACRGREHLPGRDPRAEADVPDALGLLDRPAAGLDRHRRRRHRAGRRRRRGGLVVRRLLAAGRAGRLADVAAGRGRDGRRAGEPRPRSARRCGSARPARRRRCSRRPSSGPTCGCSPHYAPPADVDTYSAASRLAQVVLLFLTSLNLLFSPFAADLHARGHREQLDALFKSADPLGAGGDDPRGDRAVRGRARRAAGVRPRLRERRDDAAHPAGRPAGQRGHRQRRVHPDHGRPHRPRPARQRAGRRPSWSGSRRRSPPATAWRGPRSRRPSRSAA